MSRAKDIELSNDLFVMFDEQNKSKTFEMFLTNNSDVKLSVNDISVSLDHVKVLNFNKNESTVDPGEKMKFVFECEFVPTAQEGKIRFTFFRCVTLTRTIKTMYKERLKLINAIDSMEDEEWIKEFHDDNPPALSITDNLHVEFDEPQAQKVFEVFVKNNTRDEYTLHSVNTNQDTVKLRKNGTEEMKISPNDELKLVFHVDYLIDRREMQATIWFKFFPWITLTRTVTIVYRQKGKIATANLYDIPLDLQDLMHSEGKITHTQLLDSLDNWACTSYSRQGYAPHFHNLLYMEEIGLAAEMREKYDKSCAYFGDQFLNKLIKNGKPDFVKEKYEKGVYDLAVNDLFETRPSLQIGDKIVARKRTQPDIPYEGAIIDIKENDLIVVRFNAEFVEQFEFTSYIVQFVYSRAPFFRLHQAIDAAIKVFGMNFIMPRELFLRKNPILDISLDENLHMVNKKNIRLKWINKNLDDQQRHAVLNVLRGDYLSPYIIHGPPGTGKTTTLSEIVLQILKNVRNSTILIATQSNSAANLIAERLVASKQFDSDSLLRLNSLSYHNKSITPEPLTTFSRTLEELVSDESFNVLECMEQMKKYRIVIGTSVSMGRFIGKNLLRNHFTHAIIDEAGQSTEMGVLIPMVLVGKHGQTIMAGDPMQMSPLVLNKHANTRGLSVSMLSRMLESYANLGILYDANKGPRMCSRLVSKLVYNYRALPSILDYYNKQFYKSELIATIAASGSIESNDLEKFCNIFTRTDPKYPTNYGLHFIDIDGKNIKRKNSWCNIPECKMIKTLTENLLAVGLKEKDLGIITPYSLQMRAIENSLKLPEIRIGTVEDFQGLERNVVLISTVRTCPDKAKLDVSRNLGFVKCPKRINVAMSRARVMTVVVGKGALLSRDENWNALIEACKANNTYTSIEPSKSSE